MSYTTLDTDDRADLDEVLGFANKVREAGGANPLDGLMPSVPEDASKCLIARNLNFSCEVEPIAITPTTITPNGVIENAELRPTLALSSWIASTGAGLGLSETWAMFIEDEGVRDRIADELGLQPYDQPEVGYDEDRNYVVDRAKTGVILPDPIAAVAKAFDTYAMDEESEYYDLVDAELRQEDY